MRSFIALWPAPEVLDVLTEAVRRGRRHGSDLRWTRAEEWHLTLLFLGEVPEERVPGLTGALENALGGHPALDLALAGWGTFPQRGGRASVFWAGVEGEGLLELVHDLREAARSARVPIESRPFVPHLTLARARPPRSPDEILRALGASPTIGWRADRIDLVQSRPGRADRYRTVRTWGLPWGSDSQRTPKRGTS